MPDERNIPKFDREWRETWEANTSSLKMENSSSASCWRLPLLLKAERRKYLRRETIAPFRERRTLTASRRDVSRPEKSRPTEIEGSSSARKNDREISLVRRQSMKNHRWNRAHSDQQRESVRFSSSSPGWFGDVLAELTRKNSDGARSFSGITFFEGSIVVTGRSSTSMEGDRTRERGSAVKVGYISRHAQETKKKRF